MLDIVEPLQQHEQTGFSAAGLTVQPDPLPRLATKSEFVEYLEATRRTKRNVVEGEGRAPLYQRLGFRMVAQFVRKQQGGNRFGQPGDMLGHIDQRTPGVGRG